jgi:hypothetical protein
MINTVNGGDMTTMTRPREITMPPVLTLANIEPVATDPGVQAAQARVDALRRRLQAVMSGELRVDPTPDHVARLLADPHAVLAIPQDRSKQLSAEGKALPRAIDVAVAEVGQLRREVGLARAKLLRPLKVAAARELLAALERATELLSAEVAFCKTLESAGYDWEHNLPRLAYEPDVQTVERIIARITASGLLED